MKEEEEKKKEVSPKGEKPSSADEKPFVIKPYLKVELARLYSPHLSDRSAMNKLNSWIRRNPQLYARLYNGREGKNDICFSARQVRLLVEHLDEP
jgi:hypothetical protein